MKMPRSVEFLKGLWLLIGVFAAIMFFPPAPAFGKWVEKETRHFVFQYHEEDYPAASELIGKSQLIRSRVYDELGFDDPQKILVKFATNKVEFHAIQPPDSLAPEWAAGIAYLTRGLIIIRLDAFVSEIEKTFIHELSHIALARSVNFRPLPYWFMEGFAIYQAGEWSIDRSEQVIKASLGGSLYRFEELEESFPSHVAGVRLAYAQSSHFIGWLIQEKGLDKFHRLISGIGKEKVFYRTFEKVYGSDFKILEEEWLADLKVSYSWIPIFTGSMVLWLLITFVFIGAFLNHRRKRELKLKRMAKREAQKEDQDDKYRDLYPPSFK